MKNNPIFIIFIYQKQNVTEIDNKEEKTDGQTICIVSARVKSCNSYKFSSLSTPKKQLPDQTCI